MNLLQLSGTFQPLPVKGHANPTLCLNESLTKLAKVENCSRGVCLAIFRLVSTETKLCGWWWRGGDVLTWAYAAHFRESMTKRNQASYQKHSIVAFSSNRRAPSNWCFLATFDRLWPTCVSAEALLCSASSSLSASSAALSLCTLDRQQWYRMNCSLLMWL